MYFKEITNPDQFRSNVQSKLQLFFKSEKADKHATNLEKGIHNWALKEADTRKIVKKWDNPYFIQIYLDHLRTVYNNLKNQKLVQLVDSGEIKSHTIAFMTHQEMQPERWEKLITAKTLRDKNKYEQQLEAMTDTFTCRKCKSKKVTYYTQQVRSADEPMSIFCQCINCGTRWRC
jgi:DNA-directed RNA polymerase subunit M/transcription elongation factor TFIIS